VSRVSGSPPRRTAEFISANRVNAAASARMAAKSLEQAAELLLQGDEMVMVLNGLDTDFDTENNFYAANTIPFYYQHHPIQINTDELIRVYVVNMVEFDPINNLHLHGNLYKYYPTGTDIVPSFYTDMITLSQTERGIMEFEYQYPGKYLFHAHKVEFSEKGWIGIFMVNDNEQKESEGYGT